MNGTLKATLEIVGGDWKLPAPTRMLLNADGMACANEATPKLSKQKTKTPRQRISEPSKETFYTD
jgi:hypothetical protein